MQAPSETADRVRRHYRGRIRAGMVAEGPEMLAEALVELYGWVLEEALICKWQLPRLFEAQRRIAQPLQDEGPLMPRSTKKSGKADHL